MPIKTKDGYVCITSNKDIYTWSSKTSRLNFIPTIYSKFEYKPINNNSQQKHTL